MTGAEHVPQPVTHPWLIQSSHCSTPSDVLCALTKPQVNSRRLKFRCKSPFFAVWRHIPRLSEVPSFSWSSSSHTGALATYHAAAVVQHPPSVANIFKKVSFIFHSAIFLSVAQTLVFPFQNPRIEINNLLATWYFQGLSLWPPTDWHSLLPWVISFVVPQKVGTLVGQNMIAFEHAHLHLEFYFMQWAWS